MARRAYKYRKPKRGVAKTFDGKARSMQTSWRKYTGTTLPIQAAKDIIKAPPNCPYCGKPVPWNRLSLDHIVPTSRDGENHADNLVWVDAECNRTKGDLTGDEFKALLAFLATWPRMKTSVLDRLRIAGALYGRSRRWRKS